MSLIDDFFLNEDRIRRVLSDKIAGELSIDFEARRTLEQPTQPSIAEAAINAWMRGYRVSRSLPKPVHDRLVQKIIADAAEISHPLTPSILDRHTALCKLYNTVEGVRIKDNKDGTEHDRDFTSLASKLLWLLHPDTVPIFDGNAWCAIKVIARLTKVATPGSQVPSNHILNPYCVFLSLHSLCLSHLYGPIDTFVAKEFSTIFFNVAQVSSAITEAHARNQYANHMTMIDQILWHLGSDVAVEECLTKKVRKKATRKKKSTKPPTAIVKSGPSRTRRD